ncbi:MAG: response regulator [Methanomicrobiaceae archaeon]|nr:response regulator [Methanomicrobiaceae archaeon]
MANTMKSSQKKILIVEDDDLVASLIEEFLKKRNYSIVDKVTTGEEALDRAIKHLPDIILMDIRLEGKIDGITATRYITSLFKIPVIYISGEKNEELFRIAAASGPSSFITKPFTANDIYSNIEIALAQTEMRKKDKKNQYDLPAVLTYKSLSEMDAYFLLDDQGRIIFLNPYAEHMINADITKAATESINKYILFYNSATKEPYRDTYNSVVRECNFFGEKSKIAIKMSNGTFRPAVTKSVVVYDSFQNPIGTLFRLHLKGKGEM